MSDRLQEIRKRASVATPGPWWADMDENLVWGVEAHNPPADEHYVVKGFPSETVFADVEFCASAREDIPWLLEQIESLQLRLRRAESFRVKNLPMWECHVCERDTGAYGPPDGVIDHAPDCPFFESGS